MARIKIELPAAFPFQCTIPVRISDINYGGHVGNDAILSLVHEARLQFLGSLGYSEMNLEGTGMIMADAGVEFKSELFYGDVVLVSVAVTDMTRIGFDLVYKLEKTTGGDVKTVALAKTGMICFDYQQKKIIAIPDAARQKLVL